MEFEARFLAALPGQGSIAERVSAARVELAGIEQQLVAERNALNAIRSQMAGTPPTIAMPGYASAGGPGYAGAQIRSEEHTSELQSLMRISYAVFCLKKKK